VTGLDGTPMPSYEESLSEEQRWDIVSYCLELMKGGSAMAQR
jgi:mono/diheme cytochrome c family protein